MKRKLFVVIFTTGMSLFLMGAVVVDLLVSSNTVSSWGEIADRYYSDRVNLPPMPTPVAYTDVAQQISAEQWDFLATPYWNFNHSGGTFYVAASSKLAKQLNLPLKIIAYEDIRLGEVIILGAPLESDNYEGLALFTAPDFMPYEAGFPLEKYLMDEFSMRRVVWSAVLKAEEDAVMDLLTLNDASLAMAPASMMMSAMSSETVTDFRLLQSGTNNLSLSVHIPIEFVNSTVALQSSTNLIDGAWSTVLQTNVVTNGVLAFTIADIPNLIYETRVTSGWVDCSSCATDPNAVCTNQTWVVSTNQVAVGGGLIYYRTTATGDGSDTDADGLTNLEEYELGTAYDDEDSDDDLMPDGYEVSVDLNPLLYSDGGLDSDSDGLVNSNEYQNRTDPFNDDIYAPTVQLIVPLVVFAAP